MASTRKDPFTLEPTLPLGKEAIETRLHALRWRKPLTWILPLAGFLVPALIGNGDLSFLCLLAGVGGVAWWWHKNDAKFRSEIVQNLIKESNEEQDLKISSVIAGLRNDGFHHYAIALGNFLLLKQKVEKEVHRVEQSLTPFAESIEDLVDRLMETVCGSFQKVARLDFGLGHLLTSRKEENIDNLQSARTEVLKAITHSYAKLHDAYEIVRDRKENRLVLESESSPAVGGSETQTSESNALPLDSDADLRNLKEEIRQAQTNSEEEDLDRDEPDPEEIVLKSLREEIDWAREAQERFGASTANFEEKWGAEVERVS